MTKRRERERHRQTPEHFKYAMRTMKYLVGDTAKPLVLGGPSDLVLNAYADSNHTNRAPDSESVRPTTGYVIFLGDSPVSWTSRTQKAVSHSPTESEWKALDACAREVIHIRGLLEEIDPSLKQSKPTVIYSDSDGAIKNSRNPVFKKKLKHLPAELHYVRDQVKAKNIRVCKIPGRDNPADAFTKALGSADFIKHMRKIMRSPPKCFDD